MQSELHVIKLEKRPDYDRDITLRNIMDEDPKIFYGNELDTYLEKFDI